MLGRGSDAKKYAKLEEKFEQGKISYDELVEKSGKVLAKEQANCSHNTTAYDEATGTAWCANDSCGIQVS